MEKKRRVTIRIPPTLKSRLETYSADRAKTITDVLITLITYDIKPIDGSLKCPLVFRISPQREHFTAALAFNIDSAVYENFKVHCAEVGAIPARRLAQLIAHVVENV